MNPAKKILIADDEKDFVTVCGGYFHQEGWTVLEAYEGVRTLSIAHHEKPDLILLDIQMPAGTGRSVLQALRSKEDTKKIPVIVVTGLREPGLKERMLAEGAQDFFEKPFDFGELVKKIYAIFTRPWKQPEL